MRLSVGGVVVVLLLAGCGGSGEEPGNRAVSATESASASARPGLRDGVTRSPSPSAPTRGPDGGAPGGDDTPRETATVTPVKVTLVRSGGFAGVRHELVVAKDGSWTYTKGQDDRSTGRLTNAQTRKLHRLAGDPRLAEEAKKRSRNDCPDSYQYQLTAGDVTVIKGGCGEQPDRPVYEAIVDLLADNTDF